MQIPDSSREPMTLTAYAKRRGVSAMSVSRAVKTGRLVRSVIHTPTRSGKTVPKISDPELADQEWAANTDHSKAPAAVVEKFATAAARLAAARPKELGALGETVLPDAGNAVVGSIPPAPLPPPRMFAEDDEPEMSSDPSAVTVSEASAHEKYWKAKQAELKFKEAAGELVPARDVAHRLVGVFTQCKTRLLGIPSAARQAMPELTIGQVAKFEELIRAALEDLAAEGAAGG